MSFHGNWNNSPADITSFNCGRLRFEYSEQENKFKTGDIYKWDLSLMTNVLIYSHVSGNKLQTDPKYYGFIDAIRGIQKVRNEAVGHAPQPTLTENGYIHVLKDMTKHLIALGIKQKEIEESIASKFMVFTFRLIYGTKDFRII